MNENRFWEMIEEAWEQNPKENALRQKALGGEELGDVDLESNAEAMVQSLKAALAQLSQEDLAQFDRILERKLYDIDREDIHKHTDGSDDGFLYARGFIVAMGRSHYDAVHHDPSQALGDCECENLTYLSWHLYKERFGEDLEHEVSRESCSNQQGWPSLYPSES